VLVFAIAEYEVLAARGYFLFFELVLLAAIVPAWHYTDKSHE